MRPVHIVLAGHGAPRHAIGMFIVTEADADAIRTAFYQEGELSAAIELRRRFRGITDNAKARACARTIAGSVGALAPQEFNDIKGLLSSSLLNNLIISTT